MNKTITAKRVITYPYFSLVCFFALCFALPRFAGTAITMVSCANLLTALVMATAKSFRSRSGSKTTAICLAAVMWVAAAAIALMETIP
jgi:type II secretory pathway component PulF